MLHGNDLRQNRSVHAELRPGAHEAEDYHENEPSSHTVRIAWQESVEDDGCGNGDSSRDLSSEGPAMKSAPPIHVVPDISANQHSKGRAQEHDAGDAPCGEIGNATVLQEHCPEGHGRPRDASERALENDDRKRPYLEEAHHRLQLVGEAQRLLTGRLWLVLLLINLLFPVRQISWEHGEAFNKLPKNNTHHTDDCECHAPSFDARIENHVRDRCRHDCCKHRAKAKHEAEPAEVATSLLWWGYAGDQGLRGRRKSCQRDTIEEPDDKDPACVVNRGC
mmetsp:Transcript_62578/g.149211  ORF Transcript_62578/g.149211 Transcript_62578/m.149211 type:complete len:278 (+) Transcript_62578:506-1339(+)|eukprot:CAMPEP_0181453874 /NCGR_PEP_ID=MMETSP1110-20121109/29948_1 /TAXON_ID=174948 /ORGANISM="Symbiodinium sp., Strain CCMP421" /LENGTH=277 /DNA_ID=CAMNT_0023578203 /DNA_START=506 /DNA_END=1339 /DNA_ORIENTATION=+